MKAFEKVQFDYLRLTIDGFIYFDKLYSIS